jgi:hypothetical protein
MNLRRPNEPEGRTMNTQTRASRASLTIVLGSVLAALVLLGGPAGAGTDPTGQTSGAAKAIDDSTASGGCLAVNGSVCSGSGVAIDGSTSSGDAVAVGGSTASGCSTAIDHSTASGGNCAPDRKAAPPAPKHKAPEGARHRAPRHQAPEAGAAAPTAAGNVSFTG